METRPSQVSLPHTFDAMRQLALLLPRLGRMCPAPLVRQPSCPPSSIAHNGTQFYCLL